MREPILTDEDRMQIADILQRRANEVASLRADLETEMSEDEKLNRAVARVAVLNVGLTQLLRDAADQPDRHLRPCRCGRRWTRDAACALCLMDAARKGGS